MLPADASSEAFLSSKTYLMNKLDFGRIKIEIHISEIGSRILQISNSGKNPYEVYLADGSYCRIKEKDYSLFFFHGKYERSILDNPYNLVEKIVEVTPTLRAVRKLQRAKEY